MDSVKILLIFILLFIIFLVTVFVISKNKIKSILRKLDINVERNNYGGKKQNKISKGSFK